MREGRSTERELMDDPVVPYLEIEKALDELGTINRWLGGHRTTRIGVERISREIESGNPITILDLASGGTDLPAVLAPLRRRISVTALDVNPLMSEYARRHGFEAGQVTCSAFALPYPDQSFDIVHISLFLHHCTDAQAITLLKRAARVARVGIVINDLQRNLIALSGIFLITSFFSRSELVRNDAAASVRRGFTARELKDVLSRSGIADFTLTRHWAFRWCLTARKDRGDGTA